MSNICVYIHMDRYLRQWFINERGSDPVVLQKGSVESSILKLFLRRIHEGETPVVKSPDTVSVVIPSFKLRDPAIHNYLPPRAERLFCSFVRKRFDMELLQDLIEFPVEGEDLQDLIYAWMESHGMEIDEINFMAVKKRFDRKRQLYKMAERQRQRRRQQKKQ